MGRTISLDRSVDGLVICPDKPPLNIKNAKSNLVKSITKSRREEIFTFWLFTHFPGEKISTSVVPESSESFTSRKTRSSRPDPIDLVDSLGSNKILWKVPSASLLRSLRPNPQDQWDQRTRTSSLARCELSELRVLLKLKSFLPGNV